MNNPLENTGFTKPTDYDQLMIINPVAAAHKLFIAAVTELCSHPKCVLSEFNFDTIEDASPEDMMHFAKQRGFTLDYGYAGKVRMLFVCRPIDGRVGYQFVYSKPVADNQAGVNAWIAKWNADYELNKAEKLSQVNADFDIITQTTK
jgi:hypothetical protein